MEKLKEFSKEDEVGNVLTFKEDRFRLHLKINNYVLRLGWCRYHENLKVYSKKESEDGIFRKNNSWSIPYTILTHFDKYDIVSYFTPSTIYIISVADAKKHGKFMYFKQSGYEKKIYIPLKYWEKHNRINFEQNKKNILQKYVDKKNEKTKEEKGNSNEQLSLF